MRRGILIAGLALAAGLAIVWLAGGYDSLQQAVIAAQREMQGTLAAAVRALRAGHQGAMLALMTACFGYGFIHAAGPGHGKVLIAGFGMGRRVPVLRLAGLALVSSLAQSVVAIVLVFAGVTALGWTREKMVGVSDRVMTPISYGVILALGLWLVWRGLRKLLRQRADDRVLRHKGPADGHHHPNDQTRPPDLDQGHNLDQGHDHHRGHDHHQGHVHDAHCGHAHGPSLQEAMAVSGLREAIALIAGIAMRPCTGALFLLILTWAMGIFGAGIAGVLAMGLGTASVTVTVAALAVWAREGALASLPVARIAGALPVMELAAGLVVAAVAGQLLLRSL